MESDDDTSFASMSISFDDSSSDEESMLDEDSTVGSLSDSESEHDDDDETHSSLINFSYDGENHLDVHDEESMLDEDSTVGSLSDSESEHDDDDDETHSSLINFSYDGENHLDVPDNVSHVRFESSVRRLRRKTFQWQFNLRAVEMNEGLRVIGQDAFNSCECLQHISVPPSVDDIKRGSFYRCKNLLDVNLSNGLKVIGARAFAHCVNLTRVKVPSTVKEIRKGAFANCRALSTVELCEGLLRIGVLAFASCTNLLFIAVPSTVREIAERAFQDCSALRSVAVVEGLSMIENCAFRGCFSLTTFGPSTVRMIDPYAFCWCDSLISVELPPSGSQFIGAAVFHGCESLRNMFVEPHVRTVRNSDIFVSSDPDLDAPPNPLQEKFQSSDESDSDLLDMLRGRFDCLPIHRICYYQAHYPSTTTRRLLKAAFEVVCAQQVDKLGMTPFHILALSTNPDISLFSILLDRYPLRFACRKDVWGFTPLDYLEWNYTTRASKALHHVFHRTVVDRGLKVSLIPRWKEEVQLEVNSLVKDLRRHAKRRHKFGHIYSILAKYELMEATSTAELAVWKSSMKNDLAIASSTDERLDHRYTCGANIVVPSVLSFLGKTQ
eukprot:CAMPEP_0113638538 /NCGR_PEP_ID=MMETSP0017_2-20120614/20191_1 /TAXON_ID=2856 /ORGANISM="Cylindrotheca closterium" /LENGTH=608 /DNA_ID=CAMNT_0000549655 /DNA_START=24 /DNA_END=1848 /DNA_ORIENTATION=- /assembly_acc=CAM_ASM_000147